MSILHRFWAHTVSWAEVLSRKARGRYQLSSGWQKGKHQASYCFSTSEGMDTKIYIIIIWRKPFNVQPPSPTLVTSTAWSTFSTSLEPILMDASKDVEGGLQLPSLSAPEVILQVHTYFSLNSTDCIPLEML